MTVLAATFARHRRASFGHIGTPVLLAVVVRAIVRPPLSGENVISCELAATLITAATTMTGPGTDHQRGTPMNYAVDLQ
jgi:hypothetical protein